MHHNMVQLARHHPMLPSTNPPVCLHCTAGRRPPRRLSAGQPRSVARLQRGGQLSRRPALLERRRPGPTGRGCRLGLAHPAPPNAGLHRQAPCPARSALPRSSVDPGQSAAAGAAAPRRARHRRQPHAAAAQDCVSLCKGGAGRGFTGWHAWVGLRGRCTWRSTHAPHTWTMSAAA